ncbi:MFS transporter [Denitrobaculum tricleocarpae]|uniref:MFS transporter n=1 Tax=Denitrobaculum tricleocarpae TaxID=2591009 RepID=A0A545TEL7_9PROT|nr:MFS transporter [Denitrobaculum tricleocarpae]TQV75668.1 MFS transporter [Denitrobaculum tricleocarpae]
MTRPLWILVFCAGAIMALSLGFRQSLGLFLTPISLDLGLGRGSFALGMGLMNLVWGALSPFAGAIADRYGAGRVAALGGLCYAGGLAALTLSGQGGQLLMGGLLIGAGLSGVGFSVILGTVGRAAPPERRSRALGLAAMGGSIGQFAALPYSHLILDLVGWQTGLMVIAATCLLMLPLSMGIAGSPQAMSEEGPRQSLRGALAEACGDRSFWLLNTGFFVCGFHLAFVAIHLPAYLADFGFAPWLAVTGLTIVGIFNMIGSYGCGHLGERYSKKNLLSLLYLARALIFMAFLVVPLSETTVILFSAAMGLLWLGTVPLTSGLVAQIYGTSYLSMLFGLVFLGHQFGGFLGAWLAGYIYDLLGSYDLIWWASAALGLISALLHWPISERPIVRREELAAA